MVEATYEEVKDLANHPEKLLIDVRDVNEIKETGMIPSSINIPMPELEKALKLPVEEFKQKYFHDKPSQDATVIFSCKLGGRAQRATDLAKALGYENAKAYKGSWSEWAERQVEKN